MDLDDAKRWLVSYVEQTAWHDDRTAYAAAVVLAALAERDAEIARLRAAVATLLAWCDEADAQNPIDQHRTLHTRIIRRRISEHVDLRALAVAPAPADGSLLAERDAEIAGLTGEVARLRAAVDAVRELIPRLEYAGRGQAIECEAVTDEYGELLRDALATAPAPCQSSATERADVSHNPAITDTAARAEAEDTRWREHEAAVDGGYCGNEFPRLWPPAPAREQADPADAAGPAPAALHRGECYRACGCDDTAPAPAELRADCGRPDHEWTPCSDCPRSPNEPCACTGDPCCRRERDEQATAAAPAPAEDNCGVGHDPERICCAHAQDVARLRADRELHQDRADRLAVELMRLRDQIGEVIAADRRFENAPAPAREQADPADEAALHRGECYRACGCDDTTCAPACEQADPADEGGEPR